MAREGGKRIGDDDMVVTASDRNTVIKGRTAKGDRPAIFGGCGLEGSTLD